MSIQQATRSHLLTAVVMASAALLFSACDSELVFEHGEISKVIAIPIMNDLEAEKRKGDKEAIDAKTMKLDQQGTDRARSATR